MPWRWFWRTMFVLLLLPAMSAAQGSWEDKNRAGEKAFQEGQLAAANRLFTEALKEAQKFGPNDERLAPIYNNLGLVLCTKQFHRLGSTLREGHYGHGGAWAG